MHPARRLLLALAASLALHASLIVLPGPPRETLPRAGLPAALHALLRPLPDRPPDSLLKDTLTEETTGHKSASASPSEPRRDAAHRPRSEQRASIASEQAYQRRLAEHLFYPPEAVARGWEGEVRLLLTLDAAGNVLQAEVAASSGHTVLDHAAVDAAYAVRRLPGATAREMILPVVFRLQ